MVSGCLDLCRVKVLICAHLEHYLKSLYVTGKAVVVHIWSVQKLWEFGFKTCFIGGCLMDSKQRIYIFLHLCYEVPCSVTSCLGNWGYYLCNCSAHWICNIVKVDPPTLFPWRTLGLDRTRLRQLLKLGPRVCFFAMYISWSGEGQVVFTCHFAQLMGIKKAETYLRMHRLMYGAHISLILYCANTECLDQIIH